MMKVDLEMMRAIEAPRAKRVSPGPSYEGD